MYGVIAILTNLFFTSKKSLCTLKRKPEINNIYIEDIKWIPNNIQLQSSDLQNAIQKYSTFKKNNFELLSQNSSIRETLKFVINNNLRVDNSLMPSKTAQLLLRHLILDGTIQDLHKLTNLKWMEIMSDESILYETSNFSNLQEDHKQRAKELVDSLIATNSNTIALMDGHGRIVWQLLRELSNRGLDLDTYIFHIYDIDHDVNAWHYRFLPVSCKIIPKDILVQTNYPQVIYLNFCGLSHIFKSPYFPDHNTFIKRIESIVTGADADLYLSGSIRGVTNGCLYRLWSCIGKLADRKKTLNGIIVNLISHRGNFVTYEFVPNNDNDEVDNDEVEDDDNVNIKRQRIT